MGLSSWVREHTLAVGVVFLFAATLTVVSAGGAAVWFLLALLGGGPVVEALGTVLPVFVAGLLLGVPLSVVATFAIACGLIARAAAAASELAAESATRVGRTVWRAERRVALGGLVDVSDLADTVDPRSPEARAEDRIELLKERYVEGRLSEFELERRVRAVLDDESVARDQVPRPDAHLGERSAEPES